MRTFHDCDGPRFLTAVTVRAHLDRLTASEVLRQEMLGDRLGWVYART
jgi:hypothetical protein